MNRRSQGPQKIGKKTTGTNPAIAVFPRDPHGTIYRALLHRFCAESGLDFEMLLRWVVGARPIPDRVAQMLRDMLGVPVGFWRATIPEVIALRPPPLPAAPKPPPRPRPSRLVSFPPPVQATRVSAAGYSPTEKHMEVLRSNGRRRRRYPSRVHDVLDELGWTVYTFADLLSKELGRKVSRSSMQFWACGTRQQGPKGRSISQPVQAPLEVRLAAEALTAREAKKRRLPAGQGRLHPDWWPNVEPDDAEPTPL